MIKDYYYKVTLRDNLDPITLSRLEGLKLLKYREEGGSGRVYISDRYPELDTNRIVLIEKAYNTNKSGKILEKSYTEKELEYLPEEELKQLQ